MDANQFNQLLQGLTNLTQELQQQQAAAAAGGNQATISPYEGDALDLTTRSGNTLFLRASEPLDADKPYDGKPQNLYPFIAALKGRAARCKWDDANHGILTIAVNGENRDLLQDYGRIPKQALLDARTTRQDIRAKQNASMLYDCLWNSLSSTMKESLDVDPDLTQEINQDGPLLFNKLVSMTQETNFIQANSMRDSLNTLHPKRYNYDIAKTNEFIRRALRIMRAASDDGSTPRRQEALYFIFNAYKKIRSPQEWVHTIQFYENQMASDPTQAREEILYEKAEALQQKISKSASGWKPSDKSPEEHVIAMLAESKKSQSTDSKGNKKRDRGKKDKEKSENDDKPSRKNKRGPPFANSPGKEGDTKTWKGKTWYYCDYDHRHGHWGQHDPAECTAKKASGTNNTRDKKPAGPPNRVQVDRNKLKQSMSAIFAGTGLDIDPSDLIDNALKALDDEE